MSGWWSALVVIVAIVIVGFLGVCGLSLYVGWKLLHPPRKEVDRKPEEFGIARYEEISFPSREKAVRLCGWYLSAAANGCRENGTTLIFAHGYGQNRLEPHLPALSLAASLLREGYDVLLFDFRNAGMSGGKFTTVGYLEQRDLLGAIDYAASRRPGQRIGLIGFSMGAVTSLLAAAQDERVQTVVADSPFYSLDEYLKENLPVWTGLPRFPFNALIMTLVPLLLRADPRDVSPCRAVKQIGERPILLIHGTGDQTVPCEESQRLVQHALHPGSALWLVPGAGHVRSYAQRPEEYTEKVLAFLRQTAKNPLPL
jgi:fermentation-respiration switch protein FrsA (DUF1100 family)